MSRVVEYPYRYFFLIGVFCAIFGVAIWPLNFIGVNIVDDTLLFHKFILIYGFLMSFANGFLITAYPNFTVSKRINLYEWGAILFGQLLIPIGAIFNSFLASSLGGLLSAFLMLYFMVNRTIHKKSNLPSSFKFVWLAYVYLIINLALLILKNIFYFNINDQLITNIFITGVILNFLFGVGLKLFPVFLGINQFQILKKEESFISKNSATTLLACINLSIILDLYSFYSIANSIRAIFLLILLISKLNIIKIPKISYHAIGIWIALIFIPIGIFLRSFDQFLIFGIHLFFISGFSLITLLVAGRVISSHGGFGLDHERTNQTFLFLIIYSVLAGISRFIPSILPEVSIITLYYLSFTFWILFIVSWFLLFFKKLLWPLKEA